VRTPHHEAVEIMRGDVLCWSATDAALHGDHSVYGRRMTDLVWRPFLLALILLLAIAALKLHEQPPQLFDDFVSGGGSFSRSRIQSL